MTTYKVGTSFSAWSFGEAYSKAKDGDILAFEEGFMLELPAGRHYKIEKSIKIVGQISGTEDGGTLYHNTIAATLRIMNGVTVQFENIWFQVDDHRRALVIQGNSTVVLNTVYFNEQLENKNFLYWLKVSRNCQSKMQAINYIMVLTVQHQLKLVILL